MNSFEKLLSSVGSLPFCKWRKKYLVTIATKCVCVYVLREGGRERERERVSSRYL